MTVPQIQPTTPDQHFSMFSKALFTQIIFAICVATFIIGVHQLMTVGFEQSYFIFMFSVASFFGYLLLKGRATAPEDKSASKNIQQPKRKGRKKSKR
ncbi:hypothetical protein PEPS_02870 [Persicobacter psychrovividus]|uniref:Uncharacterized protein n=1 Tax=Persicobacter psychrovividus TaxID=387638 RepID=A0ABM7VAS2_9BACT|nr:hypothetical protein PEPS_02870 [Persicobacter psychrovividus]